MNGPETGVPGSARANILVVDDDRRNREVLQALLQDLGQNLVLADSGEQALRCVLKDDFAVILLDARMPGVDGFETARLIRERPRSRHTPIIFLTAAYEDLPSVFRGYEVGAVDYIVKPLVPEVLRSKISVFVELHKKNAVLTREIAERRLAEQNLRESQENLRALAARLQSAVEEERARIAREIHDELGQALTGIKMDLTWVTDRLPKGQKTLPSKMKSVFRMIDGTIQSVRRIATGLRPEVLDEVGLPAAVGWQARDFQKRTGIRCRVELPPDGMALDRERSTATFRIFQEILTNVARHANATKIDVALQVDENALVLKVDDNGKGIASRDIERSKSLGLLGMRERASLFGGKVEITGTPGKGTRVLVSIPAPRKLE